LIGKSHQLFGNLYRVTGQIKIPRLFKNPPSNFNTAFPDFLKAVEPGKIPKFWLQDSGSRFSQHTTFGIF